MAAAATTYKSHVAELLQLQLELPTAQISAAFKTLGLLRGDDAPPRRLHATLLAQFLRQKVHILSDDWEHVWTVACAAQNWVVLSQLLRVDTPTNTHKNRARFDKNIEQRFLVMGLTAGITHMRRPMVDLLCKAWLARPHSKRAVAAALASIVGVSGSAAIVDWCLRDNLFFKRLVARRAVQNLTFVLNSTGSASATRHMVLVHLLCRSTRSQNGTPSLLPPQYVQLAWCLWQRLCADSFVRTQALALFAYMLEFRVARAWLAHRAHPELDAPTISPSSSMDALRLVVDDIRAPLAPGLPTGTAMLHSMAAMWGALRMGGFSWQPRGRTLHGWRGRGWLRGDCRCMQYALPPMLPRVPTGTTDTEEDSDDAAPEARAVAP
jgi:hypothetical protein